MDVNEVSKNDEDSQNNFTGTEISFVGVDEAGAINSTQDQDDLFGEYDDDDSEEEIEEKGLLINFNFNL